MLQSSSSLSYIGTIVYRETTVPVWKYLHSLFILDFTNTFILDFLQMTGLTMQTMQTEQTTYICAATVDF